MEQNDFWKEFKPILIFLGKFLALYLACNVLYGLWVESVAPEADAVTRSVTHQVSSILNLFGAETKTFEQNNGQVTIVKDGRGVLSIFEGCNGINVAVVYLSFIVSFGPVNKRTIWFGVIGLCVIHLSNLFRIILLYIVSSDYQQFMYFVHKYLFTGFIYGIVLLLWIVWIRKR